MRLEDQTIIVTGGSAGLGKAMASAFVSEGARVVCAARDEDRLSRSISEMDGPGEVAAVPTDVRSWESVQRLAETAKDTFGPIDILVNNAGVSQSNMRTDHKPQLAVDIPVDVWDTIIETNLRGVFLCTKAVLPSMLARGSGRLIHISSGTGVQGRKRRAAYAASKFGLEGFAETLALELEETDVDSLLLRPGGGTYTERRGDLGRGKDTFTHDDPTHIAEPAVKLATGEGKNGERYVAAEDGQGYATY